MPVSVPLVLIAIPGIAAVLLRWSTAVFLTARHSIELFVARQISDTRAARGDISGMSEAETYRENSRAQQLRGVIQVLFWSAALLLPLIMPGTFLIYALYGLLWLAPARRSDNGAP
jgi:hypothetical protein